MKNIIITVFSWSDETGFSVLIIKDTNQVFLATKKSQRSLLTMEKTKFVISVVGRQNLNFSHKKIDKSGRFHNGNTKFSLSYHGGDQIKSGLPYCEETRYRLFCTTRETDLVSLATDKGENRSRLFL